MTIQLTSRQVNLILNAIDEYEDININMSNNLRTELEDLTKILATYRAEIYKSKKVDPFAEENKTCLNTTFEVGERAARARVLKKTQDEWYPSYQSKDLGQLVRVSCQPLGPHEGDNWRVCAWGADNFGMERDFTDEKEALTVFIKVIKQEYVNHSNLKTLGFKVA